MHPRHQCIYIAKTNKNKPERYTLTSNIPMPVFQFSSLSPEATTGFCMSFQRHLCIYKNSYICMIPLFYLCLLKRYLAFGF